MLRHPNDTLNDDIHALLEIIQTDCTKTNINMTSDSDSPNFNNQHGTGVVYHELESYIYGKDDYIKNNNDPSTPKSNHNEFKWTPLLLKESKFSGHSTTRTFLGPYNHSLMETNTT